MCGLSLDSHMVPSFLLSLVWVGTNVDFAFLISCHNWSSRFLMLLSVRSFRICFLILYVVRLASSYLCSFLSCCLSLNRVSSSDDLVLSGVFMSLFSRCVSAADFKAVPSAKICSLILSLFMRWRSGGFSVDRSDCICSLKRAVCSAVGFLRDFHALASGSSSFKRWQLVHAP